MDENSFTHRSSTTHHQYHTGSSIYNPRKSHELMGGQDDEQIVYHLIQSIGPSNFKDTSTKQMDQTKSKISIEDIFKMEV